MLVPRAVENWNEGSNRPLPTLFSFQKKTTRNELSTDLLGKTIQIDHEDDYC
jgi:hypothetical protein